MPLNKQQYPFAVTGIVRVAQFMRAFDQRVPRFWDDHEQAIRPLRKALIAEEFQEFCDSRTKVDMLDALCDLLYVTHGTLLALGYRADLLVNTGLEQPLPAAVGRAVTQLSQQPCQKGDGDRIADLVATVIAVGERTFGLENYRNAFYAVHENNMKKLWTAKEYGESAPGDKLQAKVALGQEDNERCYVVTRPDGKVVKPPGFEKVKLEKFVGAN